MTGLPLAEPATAAGGALFSGASHANWDQDLYRPARAGPASSTAACFVRPWTVYQSVRHKRKPFSCIIDYSKPRPCAGCSSSTSSAANCSLPTPGSSHGRNSGTGRPPVLQSDEFPAKFLGSTAPPRPIRAKYSYSCVSASVPARTTMPAPANAIVVRGGLRQPQASAEV